MKIRNRLSLQFSIIVVSILIFFSLGIYYFSSQFRKKEFTGRLEMRALSNAKMLVNVDAIDPKLLEIIDRNTLSSLFELKIIIFDSGNKIAYISKETDSTLISGTYLEKLSHQGRILFSINQSEGIGVVFHGVKRNYKVFAWAYDKYGRQQLSHLRFILLGSFLISTILIWFPGYFFAGRSLSPISQVIKQVEKITASNLNLRVKAGEAKDEIAQLATTFNQMLERLEASFQMQRNFVSNASHELRTPLTAITGQIEVALLSKRTSAEYEKILISLLEDIKGLNALSNGLLDLAQSSVDFSVLKLHLLRIDDLLFEIQSDIKRRNQEYHIQINFDESLDDEDKLTISGNINLLKAAFGNIIDNGCKFSDNHKVEIQISSDGKHVLIRCKDWGIGIPENEIEKVFEPFYRAKNSRSKFGHGIGLSLSRKIIEMHKGTLAIHSQVNVGTEIYVTIPLHNSLA